MIFGHKREEPGRHFTHGASASTADMASDGKV